MAVPSGTFQTFQAVGNAEDFHDKVYDISPLDTPFLSMAKRLKAMNTTHQWQTDQLAAASPTNSTLDGDDATTDTATPTINLKNYCQLMDKVPQVSDVQEAVKHYGRDSEMAYQMAKRTKELKRDLESALTQNNAGTVGATGSAALMASLESWLAYSGKQAGTILTANGTTCQEGSAGTTPGFTTAAGVPTTAPTDSTSTGSVSEAILKNCIANAWNLGGDPRVLLCGALVKQKISGSFTGIATRFREVRGGLADIIGGADIYVSDFGEHKLVPDRKSVV